MTAVIPFYGRGNRGSEILIKSLAQGNSEVDPELKPSLLRGPCGYQSQVTGPGNGEAKEHEATLLLVSLTGPLGAEACLGGSWRASQNPSRAWAPWATPLHGRSSGCDFHSDAGAINSGELTQYLSPNGQALGFCTLRLIPFSSSVPSCL